MKEGGYAEGTIEAAEGDKVTVKVGKDERKILKKDQVMERQCFYSRDVK